MVPITPLPKPFTCPSSRTPAYLHTSRLQSHTTLLCTHLLRRSSDPKAEVRITKCELACMSHLFKDFFFFFYFLHLYCRNWISPGVALPGESQLRQSRAIQPRVHAGCFRFSIINRTLTWTTGFLTCARVSTRAIAHGGVNTHLKESALKVYSERKIPCRTGESNLRERRDGPML